MLAIAGLIFLMAFIALPSLWVSQRDADRRANVMEFINDIKTYQTNNSRGALPTLSVDAISFGLDTAATDINKSWIDFVKEYVVANKDFRDPDGSSYSYYVAKCKKDGGDLSVGEPCTVGELNSANQENASLNGGVDHKIYVAVSATCDGDRMVKTSNSRNVAAIQLLERAGRYCYNT